MKLSQLRVFVAVADSGSFSAAAAELHCTQSRVSHAIAELERALGVRLLHRSHAGSAPTDIGHRVLDKARQMLRLERGLLDVAADGPGLSGQVRVACFRSVGTHLLPHALAALAQEYPAIRVDIDDGCEERDDVTRAVREGRAEIGIAHLPVGEEFVVLPYLHDAYVFVAPAALPLTAPVSWQQFDGLDFISLNCSGAAAILERCRGAGFRAEAARSFANDSSIAAMVGRGLAYSILPRLATFPLPEEVRIADLPLPARRNLALIALPATLRTPAAQTVARFIGARRIIEQSKVYRAGVVGLD